MIKPKLREEVNDDEDDSDDGGGIVKASVYCGALLLHALKKLACIHSINAHKIIYKIRLITASHFIDEEAEVKARWHFLKETEQVNIVLFN